MRPEIKAILEELGFGENLTKTGLYEKVIDGDTTAYVDFRKMPEKGRRFLRVGNNLDADPDSQDCLVEFKKRRDEILQSSSAEPQQKQPENQSAGYNTIEKTKLGTLDNKPQGTEDKTSSLDMGQKETPLPKNTPTMSPSGANNSPAPTSVNLYEFFYELVGAGGIIEIFGDTGSLKSNLSNKVSQDAKAIGKTVFYLDTEGKVGLKNKKDLGKDYKYIPIWDEIVKAVISAPKKDLMVIDSVGFPISAKTAGMKLNEQGQAWNDMMSLVGDHLKSWCYRNNAIAIITNQPKSDFMKSEEEIKRPDAVGDKVHFAPNMILRSRKSKIPAHYDRETNKTSPPISVGTFTSHRSPDFMDDVEILIIYKNDDEVRVEIPQHVTKRLQELI